MNTETWTARHTAGSTAKLGSLRRILLITYGIMHLLFGAWLGYIYIYAESKKTGDPYFNMGLDLAREIAVQIIIQRWILASIIGAIVLAGIYYLAKWKMEDKG